MTMLRASLMMVVRTRAETKAALQDQLKMIAASCGAYDKGEKWEATRLAVSVYVVVHDRGKKYGDYPVDARITLGYDHR